MTLALPLRLRRASAADAEAIARVTVETWRQTYPGLVPNAVLLRMSVHRHAHAWAVTLGRSSPDEVAIVAEAGDRIVGFGSCGKARSTGLPQEGEVFTLYVLPDFQERGIGRALLLRLLGALRDRGVRSAVVWVLEGNPSRFFYEAMGARCVARRCERIWNTPQPQRAYAWDDLSLIQIPPSVP